MAISKIFCLIIILATFKAFGIDDDPKKPEHSPLISYTLLGRSGTDERRFNEFFQTSNPALQRSTFDITNLFPELVDGLPLGSTAVRPYLYKKEKEGQLFIILGGAFSVSGTRDKRDTLSYANLMQHIFSDATINTASILTAFQSKNLGLHVQFMEMQCVRGSEDQIDVNLKMVDSLSRRKTFKDDKRIQAIFADPVFASKRIFARGIDHIFLGIQSPISLDCNIFTDAFLYLKCTTSVDPENVKNHKLLHKTMQRMVDEGVVHRNARPIKLLDFLGHTVSLIEYVSRTIGSSHRYELENPSNRVARTLKLITYKATTLCMVGAVRTGEWVLTKLGFE